jgi:hypothetical protein
MNILHTRCHHNSTWHLHTTFQHQLDICSTCHDTTTSHLTMSHGHSFEQHSFTAEMVTIFRVLLVFTNNISLLLASTFTWILSTLHHLFRSLSSKQVIRLHQQSMLTTTFIPLFMNIIEHQGWYRVHTGCRVSCVGTWSRFEKELDGTG